MEDGSRGTPSATGAASTFMGMSATIPATGLIQAGMVLTGLCHPAIPKVVFLQFQVRTIRLKQVQSVKTPEIQAIWAVLFLVAFQ